MQCREFNKQLPLLLNGTLASDLRSACESHLDTCARCVEIFASASAEMFAAPDPDEILRTIVQATIPELCVTSADLLCESFDDSLSEPQSLLLTSHLQGCAHCQQLHSNLQAVNRELSQLAELQPPEVLLGQILRATSGTLPPQPNHNHQWLEQIRLVFMRPRFALEASFAATLLWSVLFGIPASVLNTAIAEQPAMLERLELRQIWLQTQSGLEQEIAELGPEIRGPVSALGDNFREGMESAQRQGNILWHEVADSVATLVAGLISRQQ